MSENSITEGPYRNLARSITEGAAATTANVFLHGIKADLGTGEFEKVGTHNLSPLYSTTPPKK